MNKVILMGRLTRDPEIRYSQSDASMAVARFSLAVDRRGRKEGGQQTADFINCVAFRQQAEFAERYLTKGIKIVLSGRIQTGSYTNQEGQRIYTTDVVAEEIEFAESKNASANQQGQSTNGASMGNNGQNRQSRSQSMNQTPEGFMNIPQGISEELPFN